MKEIISTSKAAPAVGPYSQAVKTEQFIFVSGEKGLDISGRLVEGGIVKQTRQALENIKAILETAGSSLNNIVTVNIYMTDLSKFDEMNRVYAEYFPKDRPARVTVSVAALPVGAGIEIAAIALS